MHVRFLLGPAGSGKTFRCLAEIREDLKQHPEGPDLILLAPKQATFQLERQLLADGSLQGYTRLQILSFERLAAYVFDRLGKPPPELLSEEGRVMVLRALLEANHAGLRVFHASARLSGFARQLSAVLRELQQRQLGPQSLETLAAQPGLPLPLSHKLSDLALILRGYLEWIGAAGEGRLEDAACLLDVAATALHRPPQPLKIGGLWLDGFAEMTPQEHALLAALLPHCAGATLAFCLPQAPSGDEPWLSPWAVVSETAHECALRVRNLVGTTVAVEQLERDPSRSRFSTAPSLARLEQVMGGATHCAADVPSADEPSGSPGHEGCGPIRETSLEKMDLPAGRRQHVGDGDAMTRVPPEPEGRRDACAMFPLRLIECSNLEAEARLAAREILGFVQEGGRFRDCAILVRSLDGYQDALRRVLTRYDIPFFLDRREPVSHHPLAELTRFALRTVALDWRPEDWLGALKTGLTVLNDAEVDRLENAALSRGWQGGALWRNPLPPDEDLPDHAWLEERRVHVTAPFAALQEQLAQAQWKPAGALLAGAVRVLWGALKVEVRLERWAGSPTDGFVHATVWDQMNDWLDNLERAFREVYLPVRDWLQIIEAGLSGLSVGVIPPALDQVLVGSVDRSRNPDLKFALVLGVNEGVFPAPPRGLPLFSEAEVEALEAHGKPVSSGRRQFGHERYLGYIALTRARQRVLVTWVAADAKGRALNPSRLVDDVKRACPEVPVETYDGTVPWAASRHLSELAGALLVEPTPAAWEPLLLLPAVQPLVDRWRQVNTALGVADLSPRSAAALYGDTLNLSVSALEAFASCPFRFFTAHGLRAREREEFEVDARQTGSFQHEVLAAFHWRVMDSGRRWRDLDPATAVQWVREIGEETLDSYQYGLMRADAGREFHARALLRNLERLVETMTTWARHNEFEPEAVEASFGMEDEGWPAWTLDLGNGRRVRLRGRVDRVDMLPLEPGAAAVAILDYKSGGKTFERVKFENGLQLQMPGYLNAICANDGAQQAFGAKALRPAGVFYVGLRAKPETRGTRDEAEAEAQASAAFQHRGRFDAGLLRKFEVTTSDKGQQFKYRFTTKGVLHKTGNDALPEEDFAALLDSATAQIRELGERIFAGEAAVSPYQQGRETACDLCAFRPICRFDSWMQPYRTLKRKPGEEGGE